MGKQTDTKYYKYLNNDELMKSLREKTLFGVIAVGGGNAIRFVIQIVGTIVLARILFPEDFGLIAMVTAIIGFFDVFKDAGLSMATVQNKEVTHEQMSTLFWIISAISLLLMFCIFSVSPVVAWFYGDQRLIMITLAFGVSIFLGGLGIQHRALLRRRMSFGIGATIDISVQFLATIIGISLALLGVGYWALVGMHALRPLLATLLLWSFFPWRPRLPQRGTGVRNMLAFGGYLSFSRIMTYIVKNVDNILIGSVIGPHALGLYSKAYSLMTLPQRQVNLPMSNTIMSALSRLQADEARYRNYFRRAIFLSTTFTIPIVIFSFVAAQEIILLFLGDKWQGAVPLFKALAPAAFIYTLGGVTGWTLIPLGKTNIFLKITLVNAITTLSAFFIGIKWGALGIALALSIQAVATKPFTVWYSVNNSIVTYSDFFGSIYRPFSASIIAGLCLYQLKMLLIQTHIIFTLICFSFIYFSLYYIVWIIIPGGTNELKHFFSYLNIIKGNLTFVKKV